jgi:hypothetical protein
MFTRAGKPDTFLFKPARLLYKQNFAMGCNPRGATRFTRPPVPENLKFET